MSTIALPAAPVKITRPTCRACGAADFHLMGCPVEHETTCRVLPADCRPEPFTPAPEDAAWWAAACDHSDWPRAGELSPEEEAIELATLDRYNAALEAMFGESRADAPCW